MKPHGDAHDDEVTDGFGIRFAVRAGKREERHAEADIDEAQNAADRLRCDGGDSRARNAPLEGNDAEHDYDSLISGIGNKKIKVYQAIEYIRVNAGKKYDSTIAAKFLETIAWYPVGIKVVLNDGDVGIVIRQNKDSTDRPVIKMLTHADGSEYNPQTEIDYL